MRRFISYRWLIAFASFGYGTLIYLMLPSQVVALSDDFGYFKSIIQSLTYGRLWTNDWLGPWAASWSALSALIFTVTGDFHFATYGLLAACAAAAFCGLCALFRTRGCSAWISIVLAALVMTFPTILFKTLQFNAINLNLPCLLAAILAYERKQWGWFFVASLIAVAARQSAIIWLAFPCIEMARIFLSRDRPFRSWLKPAVVLIAGLVVFFILIKTMNHTHAQEVRTDRTFERIELRHTAKYFAIGCCAFLAAAGLGGFLFAASREKQSAKRQLWLWGLALAGIAAIMLVDVRGWPIWWPPYTDRFSWLYSKVVLGMALAGWLTCVFSINVDKLIVALVGLALLSTQVHFRDYYLIDVAMLGMFSVTPGPVSLAPNFIKRSTARFLIASASLAVVAMFQLRGLCKMKLSIDRGAALCILSEQALRSGRLQIAELSSFAPYGLRGWHLFPYFMTHEGKNTPGIGGFVGYEVLDVDVIDSGRQIFHTFSNAPPIDDSQVIASGVFRQGWIFQSRYTLRKTLPRPASPGNHPPWPIDLQSYKNIPFPLSNEEWRDLVKRKAFLPMPPL
jgi:hypothetical protein